MHRAIDFFFFTHELFARKWRQGNFVVSIRNDLSVTNQAPSMLVLNALYFYLF